jgi:hypothetical protein
MDTWQVTKMLENERNKFARAVINNKLDPEDSKDDKGPMSSFRKKLKE